jgi:hypothetical protein
MRMTIDISDHRRSVLKVLAAQRGQRGYSKIIEEALDRYLAEQVRNSEAKEKALAMRGSWQQDEIERTRSRLIELREQWKVA